MIGKIIKNKSGAKKACKALKGVVVLTMSRNDKVVAVKEWFEFFTPAEAFRKAIVGGHRKIFVYHRHRRCLMPFAKDTARLAEILGIECVFAS